MNNDWVDEEFTVKCHNCGNITVKPKGKHWVFCPNCKTALDIMNRYEEIRWYPVTWLVEALEYIPLSRGQFRRILVGEQFTTIPRLLWKHPKEVERK